MFLYAVFLRICHVVDPDRSMEEGSATWGLRRGNRGRHRTDPYFFERGGLKVVRPGLEWAASAGIAQW